MIEIDVSSTRVVDTRRTTLASGTSRSSFFEFVELIRLGRGELFVGDVIQAAIHNDIQVDTVIFTDGKYLDIGTPEGMKNAYQIERQGWGD